MTKVLGLLVFVVFVATASLAMAGLCCVDGLCGQMSDQECVAAGGHPVQDCSDCPDKDPPLTAPRPFYPEPPEEEDSNH